MELSLEVVEHQELRERLERQELREHQELQVQVVEMEHSLAHRELQV
jgi:hypothetical protein